MKKVFDIPGRRRWGTPQRYRLEFFNENSFNRLWSFKFSRLQVIVWSIVTFAAFVALLWALLRFTPVGAMLPGETEAEMRRQLVELSIRADSLQNRVRILDSYSSNIFAAMGGKPTDSYVSTVISDNDTLVEASDVEREFVDNYNPAGRFSLSVLTPIAAEGMAFFSPVSDARVTSAPDARTTVLAVMDPTPVMAVYQGTVISVGRDPQGYILTIQHSNNFISQYSGLESVYVRKEARVDAGEAVGGIVPQQPMMFEIWHDGIAVPPDRLISF
ncbi:MAG: M23 family metallopeptidase [Muribaculaceae bacterium]|nr:M23 family metallopeptidase [Muribaculaceae bacterium]MDE6332930.1 M23 family metallopeptidase [Muribaculaceae bacterium]